MSNNNTVLARNAEGAPKSDLYSQTVAFSHYNHLSAQLPMDPKSGKIVEGGVKEQAAQCFKNIKAIIDAIDHKMTDIVRVTIFVQNIKDLDVIDEVYKIYFPTYMPTRTIAAVAAMPMDALVEIEAVVSNGEGTIPNAPQAGDLIKLMNNTENAPTCALSTQSVAFSHYNHLSAQLPVDPKTGEIVVGDSKAQAKQCLKNIKTILEGMDVPLDDIVKMNIFLTNLSDLNAVNQVYTTFFPDSAIARAVAYVPARTIAVASGLPLGARIQMEAVVSHGDGTPPQAVEDRHGLIIEGGNTEKAPKFSLSTQTVAFSHYNNLSAQLPIDPKTEKIVSGGVKEQAEQCLKNMKEIIESVDHTMDDVVKVNIFVKNIADMDQVDQVYKLFFPSGTPARRVVGVTEIEGGALIQIDAVVSNVEGTPPIV